MPSFPFSVLLVGLGFLPSLVWLVFYYREDNHPEPKSLIIKVFLLGIIVSPLAILFQFIFIKCEYISTLQGFCFPLGFMQPGSPDFFLWSAFIEELIKFYAVRVLVLSSPYFDEPVDAMIYMVTAALGFAAIENTLIAFQSTPDGLAITLNTLILRFIGATLLHALASGILGYFLAIAWFFQHHRKKLIFIGLAIATLFHFAFNMIISSFEGQVTSLLYTTTLLLGLAFLVSILFDRLKSRQITISPFKKM